jgi:hypothetical protein
VPERRDFLAWAREQAINVDLASPRGVGADGPRPATRGQAHRLPRRVEPLHPREVRLSPAVSASSRRRRISVDRRRARMDRRNLDRALPGDRQRGTPRPRGGLRLHRCRPRRSRRCAARGPRRAGRISPRQRCASSSAASTRPYGRSRWISHRTTRSASSASTSTTCRQPGTRSSCRRSRSHMPETGLCQCCTGEGACPRPATLPSHNRDFVPLCVARGRRTRLLRARTSDDDT